MNTHICKGQNYDLKNCIKCAARLVKSARPSRVQQEKMLQYVSQWHSRSDVLHELQRSDQ
jgi:hypothetical protein